MESMTKILMSSSAFTVRRWIIHLVRHANIGMVKPSDERMLSWPSLNLRTERQF